jgi:hypothetical protein
MGYRMKASIAGFLLAALLPLTFAVAGENYTEANKNADSREKLSAVAAGVRSQMHAGGRFEFVKPIERETIDRKFAEMDALFAQAGAVADMKEDAKVKLFDAQETINSILTQRDAERLICKREPIMDSHIPTTTCQTYRQQLAKAEITRQKMSVWQNVLCTPHSKACPQEGPSNLVVPGAVNVH